MGRTAIPWATHVWNPATGCSPVSEGCRFCYAAALAPRLAKMGQRAYAGDRPFAVRTRPELDSDPVLWRRPRRIFVGSMTDLFHEEIPDRFLVDVFRTMLKTPRHTYLLLTKRPARLVDFWSRLENRPEWPSHIWAGFTAESQRRFDERWEHMKQLARWNVPVFVSIEPMLEMIDIRTGLVGACQGCGDIVPPSDRIDDGHCVADIEVDKRTGEADPVPTLCGPLNTWGLRWVIAGGESAGSPDRRLVDKCPDGAGVLRPYCPECHGTGWRPKAWALAAVRSLRDQCAAADTPFFFKQWGGPTPKAAGDELDGRTYHEIPEGMVA